MAREQKKVVIIDGDRAVVDHVERAFVAVEQRPATIVASSLVPNDGSEDLPDIIIFSHPPRQGSSEVDLSGVDPAECIEQIRRAQPFAAVIVLLNEQVDERARDHSSLVRVLFEAGASDVVRFEDLDSGRSALIRAIERSLEVAALRRDLCEADKALGLALAESEVLESQIDEIYGSLGTGLNSSVADVMTHLGELRDGRWGPLSDEQADFLSIASESGWQLGRLTRDLLLVRRLAAGEVTFRPEDSDVDATFQQAREVFAERAKQSEVELVIEECGLRVRADGIRLLQVVAHLIDNALRCTPEGGTIRLGALLDRHGGVVFTVRDDGRGIADVDLPRAFDRLEKCGLDDPASEPGAGLGLAICRGIVEGLGGEIELASSPGAGTRVTFTLPRAQSTAEL